ncbi:hypothetical protein THAOC_18507, partial [Thalassiosira oceanica]
LGGGARRGPASVEGSAPWLPGRMPIMDWNRWAQRWTARLAVLILPEPMKEIPQSCKTAEDEAKLVMLDVKVQLITGEPSWFHPPFPASLANGSKVGAEGLHLDQIDQIQLGGSVDTSVPRYCAGRCLPIRLRSSAAAFETSQRQAMMPMRSTERPTGKFSTMIFNTLGTTVPPGAPVPETAARSRANKVGKISQPLKNNKTKLSNRPQFDWRIYLIEGNEAQASIAEEKVDGGWTEAEAFEYDVFHV